MPGHFESLTRRRFLTVGLAGAGALLGAASGGLLWVRGFPPGVPGLRELSAAEYLTFANIVAAMIPPGGPFDDTPAAAIPRAFDNFIADEPEAKRRELHLALTFVELAPLFDGRGTTFSRLSVPQRQAYWAEWPASPDLLKRQISLGFRKFTNMLFYDTPDVWPAIGYGGPSLQRLAQGRR